MWIRPRRSIAHVVHRLNELSAGADAEQQPVGGDGAGTQQAAGRVGGTGDDGNAGRQAELCGSGIHQVAPNAVGRLHERQVAAVEVEQPQQVVRPVALPFVQQQRAGPVAGIGGKYAGHAPAQVILGQQQHLDLCPVAGASCCTQRTLAARNPVESGLPVMP